MAAEKLRDLSQPIDVPLLDATVAAFYGTGSKEEVCVSVFCFVHLHLGFNHSIRLTLCFRVGCWAYSVLFLTTNSPLDNMCNVELNNRTCVFFFTSVDNCFGLVACSVLFLSTNSSLDNMCNVELNRTYLDELCFFTSVVNW